MKTNTLSYISIIAFALGTILLSSCQQVDFDDSIEPAEAKTESASDGKINYNVSLKSAKYLVQSTEGVGEISSVEPLVYNGDTLMYIFNFKDGWQVVSGDKRTEPIIASDEKGQLSTEGLDNPGVAIWLNDKADQIIQLKKQNPQVEYTEDIEQWVLIDKAAHFTEENLAKYREKYGAIYSSEGDSVQLKSAYYPPPGYRWIRRLVRTSVSPWKTSSQKGPLLQTKWGQGTPWNTNVPDGWGVIDEKTNTKGWIPCPTGCTAVAMAQVLYYMHYKFGKPKGLYHSVRSTGHIYDSKNYSVSFSRGSYNSNSNRWGLMKKNRYSSGNASYVGDLMADVGNRVGMKYGADGSGAWPSSKGFSYYGISCDKTDYKYTTVERELAKDKPVITVAWAKENTYRKWFLGKKRVYYTEGHSWVIDGYRKKQKTYTYTYQWELVRYDPYNP
jgi:hypothetical protein